MADNYMTTLTIGKGDEAQTFKVGAQPDWNQNDPAKAGYVLNRTHWAESELVEIFAEQSLTFDENEGAFVFDPAPELVAGKTYIVKWNGTEYTCVAFDASEGASPGAVGMGNPTQAADGEPFFMLSIPGVATLALAIDGATEVTASITECAETIHTLDPKYLPASASALVVNVPGDEFEKFFSETAGLEVILPGSDNLVANHLWNGGRVIIAGTVSEMQIRMNVAYYAYITGFGFMMAVENGSTTVSVSFETKSWTPPAE